MNRSQFDDRSNTDAPANEHMTAVLGKASLAAGSKEAGDALLASISSGQPLTPAQRQAVDTLAASALLTFGQTQDRGWKRAADQLQTLAARGTFRSSHAQPRKTKPCPSDFDTKSIDALNASDLAEHKDAEAARAAGYDGPDSALGVALFEEEQRQAAVNSSKVAGWASGSLFAHPNPTICPRQ